METCDALIIGCGIAGATLANELSKQGMHVIVLAIDPAQSNSAWAQGGIVFAGDGDGPEALARDIYEAGHGLCNPAAVEQLAQRGPQLVQQILIDEVGIGFDRRADGRLSLTQEAAHSLPRILHQKDQTGQAILTPLVEKIKKSPNIQILSNHTAVDLVTLSHHSLQNIDIYQPPTCVGAYVFDHASRQVKLLFARETILATGGLGEVFLHTTNPKEARGDGIAMAYRAGARIMNMEYVQFHPTALYVPTERRYLLTEALRGEGARLLDSRFQPFMERHHEHKELAPRDVVSRAMFSEMLDTSANHLWLDITMKSRSWLHDRFPAISKLCLDRGFDLSSEPIPIVPAAHYSCGGIAVDGTGRTSIRRLRAIGEVSCTGLHGANRLASTSLLEGLVWAKAAADDLIAHWAERRDYFPLVEEWQMSHERIDSALVQQDWTTIKQTMWNYVGLVRDKHRLRRALKMLRELQWEIDQFYEQAELNCDLIGLRNGVLTALLITQGAWRNRQSIGCHYRIT